MKSINNYLFEKLTVNSETKNEDMPKVYSSKSGKELQNGIVIIKQIGKNLKEHIYN